ncbi:MAG TPA: hypothetical protein VKZ53_21015 [Candidatus Angelobacter sp.]|nr:hypothetical protein [Candidatus Angelobacter sp.]
MFVIFHQNMQKFNGANAVRNAAFVTQMGAIGAALGPTLGVAGYTELISNLPAMHAALPPIATALDGGLTNRLVICVGKTSVGNALEYIGIVWDPGMLNVQHAGQVLWDPVNRRWGAARNTTAPFPANRNILLPGVQNYGADTRGLAYIACRRVLNNNPFIIGFLHNMYSIGDRTAAMQNLDTMASRARAAAGAAYAAAEIIIGGDFNVQPPPAARPSRKRARGAALRLTTRVFRNGFGVAQNTTLANPYDYWLVSDAIGITDAHARRYTQTRWDVNMNCSDHAGVTLDRN